jgi:hypothetical protein
MYEYYAVLSKILNSFSAKIQFDSNSASFLLMPLLSLHALTIQNLVKYITYIQTFCQHLFFSSRVFYHLLISLILIELVFISSS